MAVSEPHAHSVLVVDDSDDIRDALVMALTKTGFAVVAAGSGYEALDTFQTGFRPCVVLLDVCMPQMDGWEFMQRQRSDWRLCTVPTIVMTGVASHDPRCLEMPIVRFLQKPYSGEQVLAAVSAELARPAHHSA